jgi:hypothetical protein
VHAFPTKAAALAREIRPHDSLAFVDVHTEVASNGNPEDGERDENGFVMSLLPV